MNPGTSSNNPLGIDGIEYVEYATTEPQSFAAALERLGSVAIARHRSREIVLFRAGGMNIIVHADPEVTGPSTQAAQHRVSRRLRCGCVTPRPRPRTALTRARGRCPAVLRRAWVRWSSIFLPFRA